MDYDTYWRLTVILLILFLLFSLLIIGCLRDVPVVSHPAIDRHCISEMSLRFRALLSEISSRRDAWWRLMWCQVKRIFKLL